MEAARPSGKLGTCVARWLRSGAPVVIACLLGLALGPPPSASADATFAVNSTADAVDATTGDGICETAPGNGVCTLRAAIQEANAGAGADAIQVPAGTYVLTVPGRTEDAGATGDLDITDDVTITGAGAEATIVDGDDLDRIFDIAPPVAGATSAVDVTISGLTVADGLAQPFAGPTDLGEGGGIRYASTLTVSSAAVVESEANFGGGLASSGASSNPRGRGARLTLVDSVVARNGGTPGGFGGGGIHAGGSTSLTVVRSTISDNTSGGAGGGISASSLVEPVVLTEVTISGNRTIREGGGISASGLVLTGSTISENRGAGNGGGLGLGGSNTISNTTISGNQAVFSRPSPGLAGNGGGIAINGDLTLTHVTVAGNSADVAMGGTGGGLSVATGTTTLVNSIVASSTGADCAARSGGGGTVQSEGNNIDSDGTCNLTAAGDLPSTTPLLAPLADNGGPTLTHALLPGSPALDAGRDAGVLVDQRGVARPQGAGFDIGAFELEACLGLTPTVVGTAGEVTLTGTPENDVIVGLGGNDTIDGLGSNDRICGGPGQDRIAGGEGSDIVSPGPGDDDLAGGIEGGPGSDVLSYTAAAAGVTVDLSAGTASGGNGNDTFAGFENVEGSPFADTLTGDGARNNLFGHAGDDTLNGGGGSDGLDPGPGNDAVNGNGGFDLVSYFFRSGPVTVTLPDSGSSSGNGEADENDTISSDVEAAQGGSGGDTLTGNDLGNSLFGQAGDDTLNGEGGNDGLDPGLGADTLNGGEDIDTASYFYRAAGVTLSLDGLANDGETGEGDNIGPTGDVENLQGGRGGDTLTGNDAVNRLNGQGGEDLITSRDSEADTVLCGAGADSVTADNLDLFPEPPGPPHPCEEITRG